MQLAQATPTRGHGSLREAYSALDTSESVPTPLFHMHAQLEI